ncbi:type II toxin-antitoxin system HipA family toxin [uncultured Erythrobacter sp.]|uniref:type II toxin-antitoxin system HipA family toxin n=1 Tax=uncultured Erythrobacter sp. TaxID=263913 RepID=UPI00260898BB|nr:HipA domain-containing protein [uncultured Erythrobacter sp.]
MLYLVGENIDKHRANYGVEQRQLTSIMRGILIDADDNADDILLNHAVRIANYLYPKTYLSGASAERLTPTLDGRLFLSGRRGQRTRLRGLEIVQTRAPERPETEPVTVTDGLGDITFRRATARFRFLESFRSKSEAGAAIDEQNKVELAERLAVEAESVPDLVASIWRLAEANGWRTEADKAERFLTARRPAIPAKSLDLYVEWHGETIGTLSHDGTGWLWRAEATAHPNPVRSGTPGTLPPFIESLLPEGWLDRVVNAKDDRERLTSGTRYMSNITITSDRGADLPADVLQGNLGDWMESNRFTGRYQGPAPEFDETLEQRTAAMFATANTPRLSGVQIKAPMTLTDEGVLHAATRSAFTHILKPSPGAGFEGLPSIEHACLTAAKACGFDVPAHALVPMPGGLPDALLIERFDIRTAETDLRRLAMEDMASVRGLTADEKYQGSIEQVGRALRPVSTAWEQDGLVLLRRALFAWLIADGDMHLKNLAVLRTASIGADHFTSVRLAPVYDTVTTRVFPGLETDDMALTLNGKRNRLKQADFARAGATLGLPVADIDNAVATLSNDLIDHLDHCPTESPYVEKAQAIWRDRLSDLGR